MSERIGIGRVIEISNSNVTVEIFQKFESSHIVSNGSIMRIAGVGNFIKINELIYQINIERITDEEKQFNKKNNKIAINRVLKCQLIGYFERNKFFEGTNGSSPDLFQTAYKVSKTEEQIIYTNATQNSAIDLGYYVLNKDIRFIIDINSIIASHILIVGNTGSGKSNTLAKLYEKLFDKLENNILESNSKFLIIDTNGEYSEAFTKNPNMINRKTLSLKGNKNTLKIPIRSLNEDDWKILLEATDKTQYPIIKKVVGSVTDKIFNTEKNASKITDFINNRVQLAMVAILESRESPSNKISGLSRLNELLIDYKNYNKFKNKINFQLDDNITKIDINNNRIKWKDSGNFSDDLQEIITYFKTLDVLTGDITSYTVSEFELLLNLELVYRIYKYNLNENNISPMMSRFISNKSIYYKLFEPFSMDNPKNPKDLEYLIFNTKPVAICDFSKAGKMTSRSIVSLLASKIFENSIEERTKTNRFSYHIIVDEAHNYLSRSNIAKEDAISESCIETFEKIIKEGRKFNTFITMATQRPSEITPTLLSQAHNYIIHKLVNPNDIKIINSSVPFLDEMSGKMIPILSPGQAIFSGTAFSKPNIVKVDMPVNVVKSDTINLLDLWSSS